MNIKGNDNNDGGVNHNNDGTGNRILFATEIIIMMAAAIITMMHQVWLIAPDGGVSRDRASSIVGILMCCCGLLILAFAIAVVQEKLQALNAQTAADY